MNNKKIDEWMIELADWFEKIAQSSTMTCTNELNMKRAQMWRKRTAQVEAMTCDRCRWWVGYGHDLSPIWECGKYTEEGDRDFIKIETCGPKFGCIHWEEKL